MAKNPRKGSKPEPPSRDARSPSLAGDFVLADGEPLNLHNRYWAAFLSWLIPGAGHFYQGRTFKATIYFTSIMACIVIGLIVSGGRCVYASWNGQERRWQFALQAGVGVQAIPATVQSWRAKNGNEGFLKGWFFEKDEPAPFSAPRSNAELDEWHHATASGFELGSLYTMVAGLLNILVVFDAFKGPLPPPAAAKRSKRTEGDDAQPDEKEKGER